MKTPNRRGPWADPKRYRADIITGPSPVKMNSGGHRAIRHILPLVTHFTAAPPFNHKGYDVMETASNQNTDGKAALPE